MDLFVQILMGLACVVKATYTQHYFPMDNNGPGFQRLANSPAYIDKTLLIEEVLRHPRDARLILAPSGFGKSLHLSMLQDFFQIPLDKNGSEIPKEWSSAFKIFRGKKIGHSKFFDEFGTRGVVFFDLNILHGFNNLAEYLVKFRNVIQKSYKQHMYLIHNARSELDLSLNRQIFERCGILDQALPVNCSTLEVCGSELPQLVQNHFEKGVLLLIDAISTPFERMLDNPDISVWTTEKDRDLDRIIGSLQLFLSSLVRGNHGVWRSYSTAITGFEVPYAESTINVEFASIFTSRKLTTSYGFTQEDLEELTTVFGMSSEEKTALGEYLDGYAPYWKNESAVIGPIYCPGFVTEYLGRGRDRPQLTPTIVVNYSLTRSLTPFKNLLSPKLFGDHVIKSLKPDAKIEIKNVSKIPFKSMMRLREAELTGATKNFEKSQESFLLYLLEHGYFTAHYVEKKLSIKISNKIARLSLRNAIAKIQYYQEYLGCSDLEIQEFKDCVDNFDGTQKALNDLKNSVVKTFWQGLVAKSLQSELEISAPIYTFLTRSNNNSEGITDYGDIFVSEPKVCTEKTKKIHSSNKAAGLDVVFVRRKKYLGVLFGTKFDKRLRTYHYADESSLTAQQILEQMLALKYYTYFTKERVKSTILISIRMNLTHIECCSLYNSYDINKKVCVEMLAT